MTPYRTIADMPPSPPLSFSLWCWLFGHGYKIAMAQHPTYYHATMRCQCGDIVVVRTHPLGWFPRASAEYTPRDLWPHLASPMDAR